MDTLKDTFVTRLAKEVAPYATELRHEIHQHPELGLQEYNTTAIVRRELENMGVEIQELGLETGCVAIIHGQKPGNGKVIGLRADMDALPMDDLCGKPWASKVPGVAHTCGHDMHTACLLAAAKALMQIRDQFSGIVKLIFQPAEEGLRGSKVIIEKGGLENPRVECMTALHGTPAYKLGTFALASGKIMASSDEYQITFKGKSAHASRPVEGRNALLAAAHALIAIQEIVPNEVRTKEEAVISTCILKGGTASNIVPDTAILGGTVRALDPEVRVTLEKAIRRSAEGAALLAGCEAEVDYQHGTPVVINDPEIAEQVHQATSKVVGEENVVPLAPLLGGEDFSFYTEVLGGRTTFYRVGTGQDGVDNEPTLHNAHYDTNDAVIPYAIAAHIQYVLDVNG